MRPFATGPVRANGPAATMPVLAIA